MNDNKFKLPPMQFSNAINDLIPDFNFQTWENSIEWKIFNAGASQAAEELQSNINSLQKKYQEELNKIKW